MHVLFMSKLSAAVYLCKLHVFIYILLEYALLLPVSKKVCTGKSIHILVHTGNSVSLQLYILDIRHQLTNIAIKSIYTYRKIIKINQFERFLQLTQNKSCIKI